MGIEARRSLRHMAWANQQLYTAVQNLDDEALSSYLTNPEWTVATILKHILDGADWYVYCLTGANWHENPKPSTAREAKTLAVSLAEYDAAILSESNKDDELLAIQMEDGVVKHWRSTLIAQAIHHAAEHRAQLVAALEHHNYSSINLDDIDLWAFERWENAQFEQGT